MTTEFRIFAELFKNATGNLYYFKHFWFWSKNVMEFNNRKVENSDEDKDLWARASEV